MVANHVLRYGVLVAAGLAISSAEARRPLEPSDESAAPTGYIQDLNAAQPLPALKNQENINYDAAVDALSPLTAPQIRALRRRLDKAKRAGAAHPNIPSKPVYSVQTVDLSPGSPPPIVRVSQLGAAVTFIDSTGAPWDILEVNNMAEPRFEVLKPVPSVPTITITAHGDYVEGDVAVFLKDLSFPIVVKMVAGQRETDYRLDIRIPRQGPNARPTVASAPAIDLPNTVLQSLLEGIEPPSAKPIHIQNAPAGMKAWLIGQAGSSHIVLRTALFLNSPAYYGSLTAADGTHVYEIPQTPIVTVSENGALRNLFLDWE